jgi:hypothetical protein
MVQHTQAPTGIWLDHNVDSRAHLLHGYKWTTRELSANLIVWLCTTVQYAGGGLIAHCRGIRSGHHIQQTNCRVACSDVTLREAEGTVQRQGAHCETLNGKVQLKT